MLTLPGFEPTTPECSACELCSPWLRHVENVTYSLDDFIIRGTTLGAVAEATVPN